MALHPDVQGLIDGFYEQPDYHSLGVLADKLEEMGHPHAATLREDKAFTKALADHLSGYAGTEAGPIFASQRVPMLGGKIGQGPPSTHRIWNLKSMRSFLPKLLETPVTNEQPIKTEEPKVKYSRGEKGKPVWSVDPALRGKDATAEDKEEDLKKTIKEGEKEPEEPVQKAFGVTKTLHHTPAGPGPGGVVQRPGPMALHQAVGDLLHHAPAGMSTRNPRDQTLQNHLYGMAEKAGQGGLKGKSGAMYHVRKWRPREEPAEVRPELDLAKYARE